MKKEQKNVSLATEIIGDLQDVVSTTLSEIEALNLDLDMAEFILNELLELTDKEPENELEALRFAQNQHRIYKYADIARDYVGRVSSGLYDLKITIRQKENFEYEEAEEEESEICQEKFVTEPIEKTIAQRKQVFSFRAGINDISCWKAYSTATGQTMESVGNAAMTEYLKNHPLKGNEKVVFDALLENLSKEVEGEEDD